MYTTFQSLWQNGLAVDCNLGYLGIERKNTGIFLKV